MGLILLKILSEKGPPPNNFFAPRFSFFGHLLPTVRYCSKLCTDKFMETVLLVIWQLLKNNLFKTNNQGRRYKQFDAQYQTSPSSGGIEY